VVKVKFNLRGREYNGRHFVSLDMWTMDIAAAGNTSASNPSTMGGSSAPVSAPVMNQNPADNNADGDDLPF
jgi:hypothetical protein